MKPEEYTTRQETLQGWPIRILSYKLGDRYHATVENVEPGARIARGEGRTREEAEKEALEKAKDRLGRTRRFPASG